MSIQEVFKKLNPTGANEKTDKTNTESQFSWILSFLRSQDFFIAAVLVLVALIAFGLGRLSIKAERDVPRIETPHIVPKDEIKLETAEAANAVSAQQTTKPKTVPSEGYVASKSGAKYHLPWCPGAGQIKEENKIWFKTKAEAEAAGYLPAANCKGI